MKHRTTAQTLELAAELQKLVHNELSRRLQQPLLRRASNLYGFGDGYSRIYRARRTSNKWLLPKWLVRDSSSVMIRRLIETLIIECYETHQIQSNIKDRDGNYLF